MQSFYELAYSRRSIRKFEQTPVPHSDIEYFINAAATAPSGCNSQLWHFVAVTDTAMIDKLAIAVEDGIKQFYSGIDDGFMQSRIKASTFFKNAPLVILVFMGKMEYYDVRISDFYTSKGYNYRESTDALSYPDVLSIGAAVQNMLLAIHEKGYGACWMNDPAVAGEQIKQLFNIDDDKQLMSVVPVGKQAYKPRDKKLKPLSEILQII